MWHNAAIVVGLLLIVGMMIFLSRVRNPSGDKAQKNNVIGLGLECVDPPTPANKPSVWEKNTFDVEEEADQATERAYRQFEQRIS